MANMSMLKAVVNAEARVRVAQFQALPSQGLLFSACLSGASCLHCPPARGHKHGGLSGRPASSLSNRQQQAGTSGQSQSRAAAESTHGHHGTVSRSGVKISQVRVGSLNTTQGRRAVGQAASCPVAVQHGWRALSSHNALVQHSCQLRHMRHRSCACPGRPLHLRTTSSTAWSMCRCLCCWTPAGWQAWCGSRRRRRAQAQACRQGAGNRRVSWVKLEQGRREDKALKDSASSRRMLASQPVGLTWQ